MLALQILEWILHMWLPLCPNTWKFTEARTSINQGLHKAAPPIHKLSKLLHFSADILIAGLHAGAKTMLMERGCRDMQIKLHLSSSMLNDY